MPLLVSCLVEVIVLLTSFNTFSSTLILFHLALSSSFILHLLIMFPKMADFVGVVVSGLIELILEKLGSAAFEELGRLIGVIDELKSLKSTLTLISGVLLDAEQQQSNNSVSVWLKDLKDVVYDIEDFLDLISTEDLERKVNPNSIKLFTNWRSSNKLAQELKSIKLRLDKISANRRDFNFQEQRALPTVARNAQQRETHSHFEKSEVFGREEDKEGVVSRVLLSSSHEVEQFTVIPVIGIGGIGKTTLAKLVLADPRVVEHFELRLWAYVSKNFDLNTVIENIIVSVPGKTTSNSNLEALQKELRSILTGETFLLVLDDVWIEDPRQWMKLKELLAVGSRSAIIVTCREKRVASVTGTTEPYELKGLPIDDCLSIFVKCAFEKDEEKSYPKLVQIGNSIVQKCCGVPLAVQTFGSLLRFDRDEWSWKRIEGSELWRLAQTENDILPVLKLSFDYTPSHLKPCFAFLALCAKGKLMCRNQLIVYWMAQGLLQPQEETEIEDVGSKYFDELVSRSFFQPRPRHRPADSDVLGSIMRMGLPSLRRYFFRGKMRENYKPFFNRYSKPLKDYAGKLTDVEMHDLMHDLAAYVAGKEAAVLSKRGQEVSAEVRHIKCESDYLATEEFPQGLLNASKSRTFLCSNTTVCLSKSFLERILSNFKCLRILELQSCGLVELPGSIGDLRHLRLLNLRSNSRLKVLPNSSCKLVNLQCLNVLDCLELQELPRDVHKLVSLRWLGVTSKFTSLPEGGIRGWTSLRSLYIGRCPNLTALTEGIGSLIKLRRLGIFKCDKLASLPNNMKNLRDLHELDIEEAAELNLIGWEGLSGMLSLKYISFICLPKVLEFPEGIASAAASLLHFKVINCEGLRRFPEGLQNCTSLVTLELFPCQNLSDLPTGIHALKKIQLLHIGGCPNITESWTKKRGHDWHLISHIPNIKIEKSMVQSRREDCMWKRWKRQEEEEKKKSREDLPPISQSDSRSKRKPETRSKNKGKEKVQD